MIAARERLSALDPDPENEPKDSISAEFWERASSAPPHSKERTVAFLTDLACSSNGAPYVARGLLRNGRIEATGSEILAFAAQTAKRQVRPGRLLGRQGLYR